MLQSISKKILTLLVIYILANPNIIQAQLPGTGIFFQAIARDNASNAAKDRKIYVQSNILQHTAEGYSILNEEFETTTDATGVFSISIGLGKRIGGSAANLQSIIWADGPYFLNLKIAITPLAPILNWDYTKDLIDLGTTPFGTVPYALYSGSSFGISKKLNISDTTAMLNARIARDTISLSNRIGLKENVSNKSTNLNNTGEINDEKYPSVKAVKTYVDAAIASIPSATVSGTSIGGSITIVDADANTKGIIQLNGDLTGIANNPTIANNAISTIKIIDGAITDSKIATGISASKVGLGNVTNNPQIYSLNGLTNQVQTFGIGSIGTTPSFNSSTSIHTLNIPMASSSLVTAGLLSNNDWNTFNNKLSTYSETDPIVSAVNGILKSNGTSISAAIAGTDYLTPSGSAFNLTNFPTLNQNTTGSAATLTSSYIDWNASTGGASILNKPNIFSGAYADLTGKPTLTTGTVTSVAALTLGTTGNDISSTVANGTTSPVITLNIPTASATNRGLLSATDWSIFNSKGDMTLAGTQTVTGSKTFSNTIVGSISGNAATATKLATAVTINGTSFDGSGNISFSTNTVNTLTFNNSGTGDASSSSFNGSTAKTISYNTIGAAPSIGSSSITTLGTITSGTWNGTTIAVANGGTGATTHTSNGVLIGNGTSAFTTVAPSTSGNVLTSNGTNWVSSAAAASVREVANEFTATSAQTSFTLSQTPSVNSKVKMFVNGVRISNTAYSVSGTTLTYNPVNNGAYTLSAGDRIQFDYYY